MTNTEDDQEFVRTTALSDEMMRLISNAGEDTIIFNATAFTAARVLIALTHPAEFELKLQDFLRCVEAIAKQLQLEQRLDRTKRWLNENLARDPDNL